jgi:rhamnosyltransferase
VVITFHPDIPALTRMLELIAPQIEKLVIVDNGSDTDLTAIAERFDAHLELLGENFGIAHAQNVGIGIAKIQGFDQVLLLDQDSLPAPDMVERLIAAQDRLRADGKTVAAVGANYIDPRKGDTGCFPYRKGLRLKHRVNTGKETIVETDYLIASGSLTPIDVFDKVGVMVDELFIDYVDIEWGLRAREMGYISYGVFDAHMEHALGDDHIQFLWRRVPVHSPVRHYYQQRNAVWLIRQSWLPRIWTPILLFRMVYRLVFFTLAAPKRWTHSRMMLSGIWDGIRGRMGRK